VFCFFEFAQSRTRRIFQKEMARRQGPGESRGAARFRVALPPGSDSEDDDLSYVMHSDDESSDGDDEALFKAALAQTPSPAAPRGAERAPSNPSPRAPPPTRALGGMSLGGKVPSNPPPVQMPSRGAGGLGMPKRSEGGAASFSSPGANSQGQSFPPATSNTVRHSSPPIASGPSGKNAPWLFYAAAHCSARFVLVAHSRHCIPGASRPRLGAQPTSPEGTIDASHVLDNETSMGGYSQQVGCVLLVALAAQELQRSFQTPCDVPCVPPHS